MVPPWHLLWGGSLPIGWGKRLNPVYFFLWFDFGKGAGIYSAMRNSCCVAVGSPSVLRHDRSPDPLDVGGGRHPHPQKQWKHSPGYTIFFANRPDFFSGSSVTCKELTPQKWTPFLKTISHNPFPPAGSVGSGIQTKAGNGAWPPSPLYMKICPPRLAVCLTLRYLPPIF